VSCLDPYYGQRSGGGELKRAGCQLVTVTQSDFYVSCYVIISLVSNRTEVRDSTTSISRTL
jgi:hypothetical protein